METVTIRTETGAFDRLPGLVKDILADVLSEYACDGGSLRGYRSPDTRPVWIRDHTHQLKAAAWFDSAEDLKDPYDFFISRQKPDGSFYEWAYGDHPLKRIECEADVEYLMVLGALRVWRATDDTEWLRGHLPALERGLRYLMTDPVRWSEEHGLVKRAFTVDTWDFQYMDELPEDGRYKTRLGPYSRFGVMHGDNSGLFAASMGLAEFCEGIGDSERAERWRGVAGDIRERANRLLFNGRYYRHFLHIDPVTVAGCDEESILSLSNTYDINRGLPTHEMAVAILDEYASRAASLEPRPFAPWFTIQPCLPAEGFGNLGHEFGAYRYINGGLMPFVGGELARAAFEHGREMFGVDQLRTYANKVAETGEAWFCYRYDGSPDRYRDSMVPRDGWGASAMFHALIEGLAGVRDLSSGFRRVRLAPRWPAAGENEAEVRVGYAASGASVGYREKVDVQARQIILAYEVTPRTDETLFHVLLPEGSVAETVSLDGDPLAFSRVDVEESRYVDFATTQCAGECVVRLGATPPA